MDINDSDKISTPSSLDVNKTETVSTSSSGQVDNKSEKVHDSKPGTGSNTSKVKDKSLTSAFELVTKKVDKIPVASVLPIVNAEAKEFTSEQQNKSNEASAGTAKSMKDSKNDDERVALPEFSGSNDHVQLQNEALTTEPVPSEVKEETEELSFEHKEECDNLLTNDIDNEKQNSEENIPEHSVTIPGLTEANSEENIPEHSVTIPGLTEAALEKRWNECELLLKKNLVFGCPEIKQLQYCKSYDDAIDKAFQKGFMDLIKLFIHNGYPCDTLLLYSLKHNIEDLIYLVIQKGADINYKGSNGETPLLVSAEKCSCEVLRLLLLKGADINAKNSNNESVLHIAASSGNYDVVKFLLDDINDTNSSGKIRDNIDLTNIYGRSALHLSVNNNLYNVAELLLDRGADIDLKDDGGRTALHICCKHRQDSHLKIFTLLYERHANINERDNRKETPLMNAAKSGSTSIVKCLLNDPYCDVELRSIGEYTLNRHYLYTAVDYARCYGHNEIVRLIETWISSQ